MKHIFMLVTLCHCGNILDRNNLGKKDFFCITVLEGLCHAGQSMLVTGVCGRVGRQGEERLM